MERYKQLYDIKNITICYEDAWQLWPCPYLIIMRSKSKQACNAKQLLLDVHKKNVKITFFNIAKKLLFIM